MKRLLVVAAAMAAALCAAAQERGDFAAGGILGVNGGSSVHSESFAGTKVSVRTPLSTDLVFNPMISYFVIDRLELSAGLYYGMDKSLSATLNDRNYYDFTHLARFQMGANYFIPIVADRLYYTPGISFGIGGGSYVEQSLGNTKTSMKIPFSLGFSANLGKFEVKAMSRLGISVSLFNLDVDYTVLNRDIKATSTVLSVGANLGMSVGVRYYFSTRR